MKVERAEVELGPGLEGEGNLLVTKSRAKANNRVKAPASAPPPLAARGWPHVLAVLTLVTAVFLVFVKPVEPMQTDKPPGEIKSATMEFVSIPPGEFMMGSPENEPERYRDEKIHKVTLTNGFYMQKTEITQDQWTAVMGENPSGFANCGGDCPVETVSWNDVHEFIERLNQREGKDIYRLPTEAEWEYACRAGTNTPFSFGDCLTADQANYNGNYPLKDCAKVEYREKTTPAGSLEANAWGLYDMHGNVWEWCEDWYDDYPTGSATDPVDPSSGFSQVIRGGSWFYNASYCRSAVRVFAAPDVRFDFVGFRLVRSLP
ncbi:MAG: formylglycine-generating enzyme family protein [Desulfobacterales bacterium]|nr:formylglycine-generating enzyme family protein [Desulfobacterales bacterium]